MTSMHVKYLNTQLSRLKREHASLSNQLANLKKEQKTAKEENEDIHPFLQEVGQHDVPQITERLNITDKHLLKYRASLFDHLSNLVQPPDEQNLVESLSVVHSRAKKLL